MKPYQPRPTRFHEVRQRTGWRIKLYSIACSQDPIDWPTFDAGLELAFAALPAPPVTPERPGVGFLIAHHGRTALYVVLCWWDRENELPTRVFVRGLAAGASWRPAQGDESFCVWDLAVMGAERNFYVETVLARQTNPDAGTTAYLSRVMGVTLTRAPFGPDLRRFPSA